MKKNLVESKTDYRASGGLDGIRRHAPLEQPALNFLFAARAEMTRAFSGMGRIQGRLK